MQLSDKAVRNPEEVAGRGPGAGPGSGAHASARAAVTAKNTASANVRQESVRGARGGQTEPSQHQALIPTRPSLTSAPRAALHVNTASFFQSDALAWFL